MRFIEKIIFLKVQKISWQIIMISNKFWNLKISFSKKLIKSLIWRYKIRLSFLQLSKGAKSKKVFSSRDNKDFKLKKRIFMNCINNSLGIWKIATCQKKAKECLVVDRKNKELHKKSQGSKCLLFSWLNNRNKKLLIGTCMILLRI